MTLPPAMNTAATVGRGADSIGDMAVPACCQRVFSRIDPPTACGRSNRSERNVEVAEGGEQDIRHSGAGDVHPVILEAATEIGDVNFGSRRKCESTDTVGVVDDESLGVCRVEEVV